MKTIVDYASKVKEQHALNKTLAPVETDLTDASRAYAIGEQFINDSDLFKAKTPIAQHDALVLGTNYEAADDITTQIKNKTVTTDPVPTEDSTNPVQSNGVYVENRNIYEVMGQMGAKNWMPFDLEKIKAENTTGTWVGNVYTENDVHFTANDDGTVDVVTEATGASGNARFIYPTFHLGTGKTFTLSGCPANGGNSKYGLRITAAGGPTAIVNDYGEGATLSTDTDDYGARVLVWSGNIITTPITFEPMLRLESDTDSTYQPYAKTNQELTAENQTLTKNVDVLIENGAVNRLPFDLNKCKALNTTGTWSNNTYALNGVSHTVNSDGTISVITESGGSTALTELILFEGVANWHNMKLSGAPSTASATTYDLSAYDIQTSGENSCRPNDVVLTNITDGHTIKVFLRVRSGQVITEPITFEPMIADADYTGGYVPYAMTNRELTAENEALVQNINDKFVFDAVVTSVNVATLVTDTLANVGTKFYAALNALKSALASDEIIELTSFSVSGFGILQISNSSDGIITSTSTLLSGYHFTSMDSEASKFNIRELSLGNGAGNASLTTIATGTPSGTINRVYYDGTHIFGGTNNYLNYRKYKKISVI